MPFKIRTLPVILFLLAVVAILINYSTSPLRNSYPVLYQDLVERYAAEYGHDPYLIYAIIKAESSFRPRVRSPRGAIGLMQVTYHTGKWGAEELAFDSFSEESLYDPEINIRLGCWYLSVLNREFNNNLHLVITAYNGGSGRVKQWLNDGGLSPDGESLAHIPFAETDRYVRKVLNDYAVYRRIYAEK